MACWPAAAAGLAGDRYALVLTLNDRAAERGAEEEKEEDAVFRLLL